MTSSGAAAAAAARPSLSPSSSSQSSVASSGATRPHLSHFEGTDSSASASAASNASLFSPYTPYDTPSASASALATTSSTANMAVAAAPAAFNGSSNGNANGKHTEGAQLGRTFPTFILGLLTALEADPAHVSRSLTSAVAAEFGLANGHAPPETDAILASVGRLAEKLQAANANADPHVAAGQQHHQNANRTPSPSFDHDAVSRLIGRQPQPQPGTSNGSSNGQSPAAAKVGSPDELVVPGVPVVSAEAARALHNDHDRRASDLLAVDDVIVEDGQPLSAEKELRLLKAQVQDFARVCKVREREAALCRPRAEEHS